MPKKSLVNYSDGGVASKVSKIVASMIGKVEGVVEGMTGHSIRHGVADDMVFNLTVTIMDAIMRGGWDLKAECLIFGYITKNLFIYKAGLAIAGYGDCTFDAKSPTVRAFLNPTNEADYEKFVMEPFTGVAVPNLHSSSRAFRDHMMASVLMYHNDVAAQIGDDHLLVKAVGEGHSKHVWYQYYNP